MENAEAHRVNSSLVHQIICSPHGDDIPTWVLENENNALHQVLDRIHRKASAGCTGKDLIEKMENCRCLPLGIPPIDTLLHGGVLEGHVMEVFGSSSSGKTQLCHLAASMTASRRERVLYVDTDGSFSVGRMADILGQVVGSSQDIQDMLDLVTVVQCVSRVDDVVACIDSCLHESTRHPSMIVIDSFGWIVAPMIGGMSYDVGHGIMFSLVMYLKRIAAEYRCAVIITNHTVGSGRDDTDKDFRLKRSALGDTWPGHAHVRLELVTKHDGCCEDVVDAGSIESSSLQSATNVTTMERRAFLHQSTLGIPSQTSVSFDV